jgi:hypothetical protein
MNEQIRLFLAARGKTGRPLDDYYLVVDGNGSLQIAFWNVATLGLAPTPAEIATMRTADFTLSSRRRDQLTNCAMTVRTRDVAAWNAMTLLQKKNATLAEADVWTNIRDFIEANL